MSKAHQTRQEFNKTLGEVLIHVKRWEIDKSQKNLPFYSEANLSASRHKWKRKPKIIADIEQNFPKDIDFRLKVDLMMEIDNPLGKNIKVILDAAEREDLEFFIYLGEILEKRKANKIITRNMIFGPKSYPDLLVDVWVDGLLWLMTDNAGLQFLNGIFGENVKLHTYRAARGRLELIKHPESPIIGVKWLNTSTTGTLTASIPKGEKSCTPILKRGWIISDGCLIKQEG